MLLSCSAAHMRLLLASCEYACAITRPVYPVSGGFFQPAPDYCPLRPAFQTGMGTEPAQQDSLVPDGVARGPGYYPSDLGITKQK